MPFSVESGFWSGRRVFVTGHTGFKGAWLVVWLTELGATIRGYALAPPTEPSLFECLRLGDICDSVAADVRDRARLVAEMRAFRPDLAIHLAAQSLVRRSYAVPVDTFEVNVGGTVNFLEACRATGSLAAAVVVTTDKVYANRESTEPYREGDALGGHDPYSASKAAAEIASDSWRASFFANGQAPFLATARSGNVFGGGDWSADRLIPDAARAFADGRVLAVRNPQSVRPWQYVLEALEGYLLLGRALTTEGGEFATAWNFGPAVDHVLPVSAVADAFAAAWGAPAEWRASPQGDAPHEAKLLLLESSRARKRLGWASRRPFAESMATTAAWYRRFYAGENARSMLAACQADIARYRLGTV